MSHEAQLEAILFVADAPVPVNALSEAISASEADVRAALTRIGDRLEHHGALQIVMIASGYQLCTKPIHAELIARFLKPARQRLSRSLMEVLAIVAYRQPVTLGEIETVRAAQSDYGLRQLLERRLVREVGRRPTPGRPILYGTTQQFLHQFKLNDLSELPALSPDSLHSVEDGAQRLPL